MTSIRTLAVAVCATSLATFALPASAAPPLASAEGFNETVGPAAKDKAKHYTAMVQGECTESQCTAKFGKKNKTRTIEAVTCITGSETGNIGAGVSINEAPDVFEFIMAPLSNLAAGGTYYSVYNWTKTFQVPKGIPLTLTLASAGGAEYAICTVSGTIE